jgi:N-glycosylase/DNA lyase
MVFKIKKQKTNTHKINKNEIIQLYKPVKNQITARLTEFEDVWNKGSNEDIFIELVFCLLTPQSKAHSCWNALENIIDKDVLFSGSSKQIAGKLDGVRFCNNKSKYIIKARKQFISNGRITIRGKLKQFDSSRSAREWLVENVKGLGYKEASHFLRNIGWGVDLAILDRHILKNLDNYRVINEIPKYLPKKKYIEIEQKMEEFAKALVIPMAHLDLLFWYKETGKIFK